MLGICTDDPNCDMQNAIGFGIGGRRPYDVYISLLRRGIIKSPHDVKSPFRRKKNKARGTGQKGKRK